MTGVDAAPAMRLVSLLLAATLALGLIAYPYAIGREMTPLAHAILPLMLLGTSGGFVHGLGYEPEHRLWRILFGPAVAWPLMIGGAAALLALREAA